MSHKYPIGTVLKSIDKHKFYIVTLSRMNFDYSCEDCAFNDGDCYERIPKELGIAMGQDCKDIFGENTILKLIPEGGL